MTYSAKFSVVLTWFDHRLNYTNLQYEMDEQNNVGMEEQSGIWIPKLIFSNSLDLKYIENDGLASLTVKQKGNYVLNGLVETHKNRLFIGDENPLIYRNTYVMELSCEFSLYDYPFDRQYCKILVRQF